MSALVSYCGVCSVHYIDMYVCIQTHRASFSAVISVNWTHFNVDSDDFAHSELN